MNRLVIVGNGFDLAHCLQTGYEHFLVDYFKKSIIIASKNRGHFSDDFISISISPELIVNGEIDKKINEIKSIQEIENHEMIDFEKNKIQNPIQTLTSFLIQIQIKNKLFKSLLKYNNWTDIEQFYYTSILNTFNPNKPKINEVNNFIEILTVYLIDYIKSVNDKIPNGIVLKNLQTTINRIFNGFDDESNKMCFVNFNYTELLDRYIGFDHQPKHEKIIYIHGQINKPESVIFGYGDDSDENYKQLENKVNDDYLVHMKSFKYPLENNYSKLIEFVDSGDFEVFCVCHSLGVSDRVLLKTIFEDKNCKKIRLFHLGDKKSYFRKCIAISRHFTDKIAMRKKLVDYDESDILKKD